VVVRLVAPGSSISHMAGLRRFTFERGDSDVSFHYYLGHLDE
jgi:hypothetical protein